MIWIGIFCKEIGTNMLTMLLIILIHIKFNRGILTKQLVKSKGFIEYF